MHDAGVVQFSLAKDTITPELRRILAEAKHPKQIMAAGAKVVQVELKQHLRELQSRGNAKGWPPQKFFAGGPDSVDKRVGIAELSDTNAVITIADPRFVHRIQGGTVKPKRGQALAIPLTAEAAAAAGKGTIREQMPDLVIIKTAKGAYLARPTDNRGKGADQLRILFRLVPSVTHRPHPEDMPDQAKLSEKARAGMLKAAALLMRAKE